MGIMDYLKKKALTPVKDSWCSSYNYGRTAVNGVRDNVVEGVNKYYPDDETRAKIVRIGTDYLKKKAPDLTRVKGSWWSSYHYGKTAVNGVRDNVVEGVNKYYPDDETRAKIVRIGTKIGLNAVNYGLEETLKIVPGRKAFDKIVLPAIRDEIALQAKMSSTSRKAFDKIVLPAIRDEMALQAKMSSAGKAKIIEEDKHFGFENTPPWI